MVMYLSIPVFDLYLVIWIFPGMQTSINIQNRQTARSLPHRFHLVILNLLHTSSSGLLSNHTEVKKFATNFLKLNHVWALTVPCTQCPKVNKQLSQGLALDTHISHIATSCGKRTIQSVCPVHSFNQWNTSICRPA